MKTKFVFSLVIFSMIMFTSCQEEDVVYKVNEAQLEPFIERFYTEAAERGHDYKRDNLLVRKLPKSSNQLISGEVSLENNQRVFFYSPSVFTEPSYDAVFGQIELSMYTTLWSLHAKKSGQVDTAKVKITDPSTLSEEQIDKIFDMLNGTFVDEEGD